MSGIRAVVVDPGAPGRLALREVESPTPLPSEAIIRVAAISLNRGEVRMAGARDAGWRPGWDFAGTVETAAADGSGPKAGGRVVGMIASGSWAEQIAAPTHAIAPIPDGVSFAQASTLPVAGLTALHALYRGGLLLGKRVLITGASGGVGHFGVQLARLSGAFVVGAIGAPGREQLVKDAGAAEVAVGEKLEGAERCGPYNLALESVGGASLTTAVSLLGPEGLCVVYGTSGGGEVTFNASKFYGTGGASIYGFILFHELKYEPASVGLTKLGGLVAAGALRPHIATEASWEEVGKLAQDLTDRRFGGKAVLHLGE